VKKKEKDTLEERKRDPITEKLKESVEEYDWRHWCSVG